MKHLMSYEYLMFEAANVEDHFRVSNLVIGYGGWVWFPCDVASWHVFRSKQPALEYQISHHDFAVKPLCCFGRGGKDRSSL